MKAHLYLSAIPWIQIWRWEKITTHAPEVFMYFSIPVYGWSVFISPDLHPVVTNVFSFVLQCLVCFERGIFCIKLGNAPWINVQFVLKETDLLSVLCSCVGIIDQINFLFQVSNVKLQARECCYCLHGAWLLVFNFFHSILMCRRINTIPYYLFSSWDCRPQNSTNVPHLKMMHIE